MWPSIILPHLGWQDDYLILALMKFTGIVRPGKGGAGNKSNRFLDHLLKIRTQDFGYTPEPGTLNVLPFLPITKLLPLLIEEDSKPSCDTVHEVKGTMLLWRGRLRSANIPPAGVECWLLHHDRTNAPWIEVMGRENFRDAYKLPDDHPVEIEVLRLNGTSNE